MMLTSYAGRNAKVMRYQSILQLLLTALGAGVVICTALVHILPDGMGMLASGGLGGDESSTGGDTPTTTSNNTSFQPTNVTSTAPADGDDDEGKRAGPLVEAGHDEAGQVVGRRRGERAEGCGTVDRRFPQRCTRPHHAGNT